MANSKRDPKTKPEPYEVSDFYVFGGVAEQQLQPAAAGAAMLALLDRKLLPAFAIGEWYDGLAAVGEGAVVPRRLAWCSEEAVLLAPWRIDAGSWGGYLIAMAESAGMVQTFFNEHGDSVQLRVPQTVGTEAPVEAMADAVLPISGFPDTPSSPGSLLL